MKKEDVKSEKSNVAEDICFRHRTYQLSKAFWKMIEKDWQDWIHQSGVTINEHQILTTLYLEGKMPVSKLAILGTMHISTVVNYSKKLEKAKLIEFKKDTVDKRKNFIDITPEGRELVESIEREWHAENSIVLENAQVIEDTFGSKPRFNEVTGIVKSYYGEHFMEYLETSVNKF